MRHLYSFVLAQKTLCARERTTKDAMDALVDAAIVCDEIAETGRLCVINPQKKIQNVRIELRFQ